MTDAPCLLVVEPGLFTTLQDAGRRGFQRFGVSQGGALDQVGLALANRLVGNGPTEAAFEFTATGGVYECAAESCRVAVAGHCLPLAVNDSPLSPYAGVRLRRGDRLTVGSLRAGVRGYIAVEGGFDVPPVLGSRATHTRSGIGGIAGRPLRAGDELPLVRDAAPGGPGLMLPTAAWPAFGEVARIVFGPQDDHFDAAVRARLVTEPYRISSRSDRMACRLDGPALDHAGDFNIVSDGVADGSIQVSGGGAPILLLADRQTTGGYPKIATVCPPDRRLVAQRAPGESLRFDAVTVEQAEAACRAAATELDALLGRIVPAASPPRLDSRDLLGCNLISGVVGPS